MKVEKRCANCRRIIIEDYEKWLKENKYSKEIQCPYCLNVESIDD